MLYFQYVRKYSLQTGRQIRPFRFFGFICQNIDRSLLRTSQIYFSRQELSNEHKMSVVRQFWIFDLNIGRNFCRPFEGPGGSKLKGEMPSLANVFLAWPVTLHLLASLHGQKSVFYTLLFTLNSSIQRCGNIISRYDTGEDNCKQQQHDWS